MNAHNSNRCILMVESYPGELDAACRALEGDGYRCRRHMYETVALEHIADSQVACLIQSVAVPAVFGRGMLNWLRSVRPEIPVILIPIAIAPAAGMIGTVWRHVRAPVQPQVLLAYVRALSSQAEED